MNSIAYAEVVDILNNMKEEDKNRVPQKVINFFERNADKNYMKHISKYVSLAEQNIHEDTKTLLAILTINYWCDSKEEKDELIALYTENERVYQEELRERFNPDNIFKNNKANENEGENEEENYLAEVKEQTWYQKILEKIKNFFQKR